MTIGSPWVGPANPLVAPWWRRGLIPTAVVLATVGLVVLREIDRLVGAFVVVDVDSPLLGSTMSIGTATGPIAFAHLDAFEIWQESPYAGALGGLMWGYVLAEVVFIVGYVLVLSLFVRWSLVGRFALLAAVLFDVIEMAVLLATSHQLPADAGQDLTAAAAALALAATLKWIALAVFLVAAVAPHRSRAQLFARVIRGSLAAGTHRLSLLFLLGFGFLALAPIGNVTDQLPDVQRMWFENETIWPAFAATGVLLAAAITLWYFGRRRTERMYRNTVGAEPWPDRPPRLAWWFVPPVAIVAVAFVAGVVGKSVTPVWWHGVLIVASIGFAIVGTGLVALAITYIRLPSPPTGGAPAGPEPPSTGRRITVIVGAIFTLAGFVLGAWGMGAFANTDITLLATVSVLVVVLLLISLALRATPGRGILPFGLTPWVLGVKRAAGLDPETDAAEWPQRAFRTTWLVGDAIAVLTIALAPLGLVRSLIAPAMAALIPVGDEAVPVSDYLVGALIVALVTAPLVPIAASGLVTLFDRTALAPTGTALLSAQSTTWWRMLFDPRVNVSQTSRLVSAVDLGIVGFAAGFILLTAAAPALIVDNIGLVATTVALLTAWGSVLGGVILSMQRRRPLEVFRRLGFRSTPVLALSVVVLLGLAMLSTPPQLHAVRTAEAEASIDRGDVSFDERMKAALADRFAAWKSRMAETACPDSETWPLLLLAAEGGGGRAAYFTVDAMARLRAEPDSGCLDEALFVASGISGGSVGLVVDQVAGEGAGVEAITDLTTEEPLGRLVAAMLAGDLLAGTSGVRVPEAGGAWVDRAGHLEQAWEERVDAMAELRATAPPEDGPLLLLNSTDAVSGCRVTLVQLPLGEPSEWGGGDRLTADDCGDRSTDAGATVSFDEVWPECGAALRWSTAGLLSGRFPFVTPGAMVGEQTGCGEGSPDAQLVDGGYAEGSGLAALVDYLPDITALVAAHNACLAGAKTDMVCADQKPVVPIVVYLKNDRGFEIDAPVGELAAEVLVPVRGMKATDLQNSEDAWLQRATDQVTSVTLDECAAQMEVLCDRQVVVVSANTVPTITPPLGWALSQASRESLTSALNANEATCPNVGDSDAASAPSWATLGELIEGLSTRKVCKADDAVPLD